MATPPRFFVEFQFQYELTGRTYWLPLFVVANNTEQANTTTEATKKALEEHFKNIHHTKPVPEVDFLKPFIQSKINIHKGQKLAILNIDIWEFTDIDPNPEWSFDEHIEYIAEEMPLAPRNVAERVEAHKFPVRVVKEGPFQFDFKEFLLINVVSQ